MQELFIREATVADIPLIREIAGKTWPPTYEDLLGKDQVNYMLAKLYSHSVLEDQMNQQHRFLLAFRDHLPVGFTSFSLIDVYVFKLQKLYVLPVEQQSGLGRTLLQKVEAELKSMGAKQLLLNVNRKNAARGFYERNGFTVIKEEDIDIGNGYFMNDFIMQKDL